MSVEILATTNENGGASINLTGNGFADTLRGNFGNNILNGMGNADTMVGLGGSDTYFVDHAADGVVEAAGFGFDTVVSAVDHILAPNVEVLALSGAAVNATGNNDDNLLYGNALANVLDGGFGADSMFGGGGNDTYYVRQAGDQAVENADAGTLDMVISTLTNTILAPNVEQLALSGPALTGSGNGLDNFLFGNGFGNVLDGFGGADTMTGYGGDDQYVVNVAGDRVIESANEGLDTVSAFINYVLGADVENLTLLGTAVSANGNDLGNAITGNGSDNILNGGANSDTLRGNGGRDTFVFDFVAGHDIVADYIAGADFLAFRTALFSDANDVLDSAAQSGSDVVITRDATHMITLQNMTVATLQANQSDFIFI